MKKHIVVVIILVAALAIISTGLRHAFVRLGGEQPEEIFSSSTNHSSGGGIIPELRGTHDKPVAPEPKANDEIYKLPPGKPKELHAREILSQQNDVEIEYYGKVQDQFSNAMGGVEIEFSVSRDTGIIQGIENGKTMTDATGNFTITGYRGERLSVVPKTNGFVFVSNNGGGIYSRLWPESERHRPDRTNPAILTMWKLQGAEPLLKINQRYKLRFTNTPFHIDLLAGKAVSAGGDLKITVTRPQGEVSERTLQDWSLTLEPVDGGLVESSGARVMYWAPDSGYKQRLSYVMSTTPPNKWSGTVSQGIYLMTRNGQIFSKLSFGFSINQKPDDFIWIECRGIANTNGSRNWEGDLQIRN